MKGGLEDSGDFKEGFCFQMTMTNDRAWDLCAETAEMKKSWMDIILTIIPRSYAPGSGSGASAMVIEQTLPPGFSFGMPAHQDSLPEGQISKSNTLAADA